MRAAVYARVSTLTKNRKISFGDAALCRGARLVGYRIHRPRPERRDVARCSTALVGDAKRRRFDASSVGG
jgi:hypothetical protein